ncbi:MAG: phosphotransferase [Coxiellaceae bacterium]|nr:MAG: phosphotransferase [Coxiellaceae bacterium]
MNVQFANLLCQQYQLGNFMSAVPIIGGLLHEVWQVVSDQGRYAVKILNSQEMTPISFSQIIAAERIAAQAASGGVTTPIALKGETGVIGQIEDIYFEVWPWVSGNLTLPGKLLLSQADAIGSLVAKIHRLHLNAADFPMPQWGGVAAAEWAQWLAAAEMMQPEWLLQLQQLLPSLQHWDKMAQAALSVLNNNELLISHRDIDCKNVIWSTVDTPVLIDWEYAGYTNPGMELFGVALNWSGIAIGKIDQALFMAVLQAYLRTKGRLPVFSHNTVMAYVGYCIDWLAFNLRRSIANSGWKAVADAEIVSSLRAIPLIAMQQSQWLAWWQDGSLS